MSKKQAPAKSIDDVIADLRALAQRQIEVNQAVQAARTAETQLHQDFRALLASDVPAAAEALARNAKRVQAQGGGVDFQAAIKDTLKDVLLAKEGF